MRPIRIYTPQALSAGQKLKLDARATKHLVQVLRKRPGDEVTLFNGEGGEAQAVLVGTVSKAECTVSINRISAVRTESSLQVRLVQAIARGDKMDWVVQKAVELGVAEILPVWTERTQIKLQAARAEKRQQRWQDIAIGACEQSGRALVTNVHRPQSLRALEHMLESAAIYLHPAGQTRLHELDWSASAGFRPFVLIGPEGGFSDIEVDWLSSLGCTGVRTGPRVLRTETAGPAVLAALQSLFGDWR